MEEIQSTSLEQDNTENEKFDPEKLPLAYRSHYPGNLYRLSDGSTYQVQSSGAWKKIKEGLQGKKRRRAEKR